jgi:hypothetical protein
MLDVSLIRNQVLLLHDAGPLAEAVIRNIAAEAERHALECSSKTTPNDLVVTISETEGGTK